MDMERGIKVLYMDMFFNCSKITTFFYMPVKKLLIEILSNGFFVGYLETYIFSVTKVPCLNDESVPKYE